MRKITARYKALKSHKVFHLQLFTGILLFAVSLFFNNLANNYTAEHFENGISDIILDHLPTMNVGYIFLEGVIILIAFITLLSFHKPARIPFILKSMALFILTRAFFISLTHLGIPLHQAAIHPESLLERTIYGSGEDLFFSGHTGFPFLMAMIFWDVKITRIIFLLTSVFFGVAVLLGHLHYSIDVFSAFFITYGIYHMAVWLFKKDYQLFQESA